MKSNAEALHSEANTKTPEHLTMLLDRILSVLLFCAAPLLAQDRPIAFIPEFKINPVSGALVQGNGQTVETLRERFNLVDERGSLRLSAAPGETAAFQLVLPPEPWLQIHLENPSAFPCTLYQVGSVKVPELENRYFPDLLVPLPGNAPGDRFSMVKDAQVVPAGSAWQVIWVEIPLAAQTPAGEYAFTLRISGEKINQAVTVNLTVHGAALPPPRLLLDLNEYGDKYLYPFRKSFSPQELARLEQAVFRMGRDHYGVINPLPYESQSGEAREGLVPKVLNYDLLHPQLDWSEFDARFGPYFDGSAFADGVPLRHFYLPFNPDWPAPFKLYLSDREQYEQIWAAFAREYIRHFTEKGWTRTIFQVYCNQKPGKGNEIPWNLDEPKGVDDYQALRYYAELTHRVFAANARPQAESGALKVRFRVDISHFYCDEHRGNRDKDFRVNGGDKILEAVDIWVISGHSLNGEAAAQEARKLLAAGKEVWIYSETPLIAEGSPRAFQRIYRAREQEWSGFMAWKSVARELHAGKGSDFIFYAVEAGGQKGIYPSLRLKLLKRAIDDTRLLELAGSRGAFTPAESAAHRLAYQSGDREAIWSFRTTIHERIFGEKTP